MTGISTLIALVYVVGPWALANLIAFTVLALRRTYASRTAAFAHGAVAALGPAYGITVVVRDFAGSYHVADRNVGLTIMAALLLVACLPLVAYRFQRTICG